MRVTFSQSTNQPQPVKFDDLSPGKAYGLVAPGYGDRRFLVTGDGIVLILFKESICRAVGWGNHSFIETRETITIQP